jgi:flagellar FliJ protein
MRKRSRKLSKIVSLATSDERRCGAETGRSRRNLEEQMAKLGELNAYRQNYAALTRSIKGADAARWKDYQSFMQRLDEAVKAQQQIVRDSEQNLDRHRRRWLVKRQRLESLQRILDSYRNDEAVRAERHAQRRLDDLPRRDRMFDGDSDT